MRMALVVAVALAGCAPLNGTPCSTPGTRQCDGPDIAYCEGAKWKTYACPGICDALKNSCDWSAGAVEGHDCPRRGVGFCSGDGVLMICGTAGGAMNWEAVACSPCVAGKRLEDLVPQGKDGLYHCN